MDIDRFDQFVKTLSASPTRRGALKTLAGAAVGGLLGAVPRAIKAQGPLGEPTLAAGVNMRREIGTVNGLVVDRYTWRDAGGHPRSVSLVRYGQTGGGGYAVQFTYQVLNGQTNQWQTLTINPPPGGRGDSGFGYFVSHENYRTFDANVCRDGSNNCTIADVHRENDSPLGRFLPGNGQNVSITNTRAIHQFTLNYPHWGTTVPVPEPSSQITPSDQTKHRKYNLPVVIRWTFLSGRDYPLWSVTYNLSSAPVNHVSADMRGPYGVMAFDRGDTQLTKLEWADKFKFATQGTSVTTASGWTWNRVNGGARYNLLVAGSYEMGLVEDATYAESTIGSGWSFARQKTSANGLGCPDSGWRMPCDWSWPYQSVQFEAFDTQPTHNKKIAWGTAPYVGTGKTTDDIGEPFDGYPSVAYRVWVTFDRSAGAKTRQLAASLQ